MPSKIPPSRPPATTAATILDATAKTRGVIENLRAKLAADSKPISESDPPEQESVEELERQLQAYFERTASHHPGGLDDLRNRVIERVVDRLLAQWADTNYSIESSSLAHQVIERLAERILDDLQKLILSEQLR